MQNPLIKKLIDVVIAAVIAAAITFLAQLLQGIGALVPHSLPVTPEALSGAGAYLALAFRR